MGTCRSRAGCWPSGVSFPDDSSGAGVSIRHAAAIVGVQAPTIRSWERRYGLAHPPVTAGGHRRYQEADLQRLALMRDEIIRGRPPADAAVAAQRTVDRDHAARALTDAFLRAAQDMDAAGLHVVLDEARATFGLGRAIDDVLMTGMRLIGLKWRTGRCDVAEEHLATQAARAWLTHQTRKSGVAYPRSGRRPGMWPRQPAHVGTGRPRPPADAAGMALPESGSPAVKSVTHAATAHSAAGVVIVAHMATHRQAASRRSGRRPTWAWKSSTRAMHSRGVLAALRARHLPPRLDSAG